ARVARGPAGRPRGRPDGLGRDDQLVAATSAAPTARPAPPRARARDRRVPAGHGRGAGALRLRAYDLRSRSEGGPAGPRAGAAGRAAPTALARPSRPRWRGGRARSGAPGIAGARLPDRRAASRRPHAVGKERAQALRRRVRHALGRTGTRADGEHSRDRRPGAGARLLSVPGPCLAPCVLRGPRRDAVRRRRDRCQDPAEPVRATADAATRIRPGGMGVDAGRDRAQRRALIHFGVADDPIEHLAALRMRLRSWTALVGDGTTEEEFEATALSELGDDAPPYVQAMPPWQSYAGQRRYWDKRRTETA